MIVVSNTSPSINLAAVAHLQLLQQLYGRVLLPAAVYHEIAVRGAGQPGAAEVRTLAWIETRIVSDRTLVPALTLELDEGEAEALTLAVEQQADLLLLDERRARRAAARLGLKFIGLLGVLVEAKHRQLIPIIKPILDALRVQAGFWIAEELRDHVLKTVGE